MTNVKQFKVENNSQINVQNNNWKANIMYSNEWQPLNQMLLSWDKHIQNVAGGKLVCRHKLSPNFGQWCNMYVYCNLKQTQLGTTVLYCFYTTVDLWITGTTFYSFYVTGYQSTFTLPCIVGWQQVQCRWTSDVNLSVMSHLC